MDFEIKVSIIRDIVRALPAANFDILKRIVEHLEKYVSTRLGRIRQLTDPF